MYTSNVFAATLEELAARYPSKVESDSDKSERLKRDYIENIGMASRQLFMAIHKYDYNKILEYSSIKEYLKNNPEEENIFSNEIDTIKNNMEYYTRSGLHKYDLGYMMLEAGVPYDESGYVIKFDEDLKDFVVDQDSNESQKNSDIYRTVREIIQYIIQTGQFGKMIDDPRIS